MNIEVTFTWFEDRSVGIMGDWEETYAEVMDADPIFTIVSFEVSVKDPAEWIVSAIEIVYMPLLPCERCEGKGEYMVRGAMRPCLYCGGKFSLAGQRKKGTGECRQHHTIVDCDQLMIAKPSRPMMLADIPPVCEAVTKKWTRMQAEAEVENTGANLDSIGSYIHDLEYELSESPDHPKRTELEIKLTEETAALEAAEADYQKAKAKLDALREEGAPHA